MTDTAYYYPAPYWRPEDSGWIKSLLLFFDDVAILLPDYMYGRHTDADPTLAEPLEDRGLLQVLDPNDWVDGEVAGKLAEVVTELLTNGTFDDLPKTDYFAELSQSRIGYGADVKLAGSLVDELQAKGLARPSEDGVSIPLHPDVRTTILVLLAQLSRVAGRKREMKIHPVTNAPQAVADLVATLSRESMPSRGKVITLDLEPVAFDMTGDYNDYLTTIQVLTLNGNVFISHPFSVCRRLCISERPFVSLRIRRRFLQCVLNVLSLFLSVFHTPARQL